MSWYIDLRCESKNTSLIHLVSTHDIMRSENVKWSSTQFNCSYVYQTLVLGRKKKKKKKKNSQYPAVDGLEPVSDIRQRAAQEHGHRVWHVSLRSFLVQLRNDNSALSTFPTISVHDDYTPIPLLSILISFPRRSFHGKESPVGDHGGEKTVVRDTPSEQRARRYGERKWERVGMRAKQTKSGSESHRWCCGTGSESRGSEMGSGLNAMRVHAMIEE